MISLPFSENAAEIFQLTEKNALKRNNPNIFPEHMIEVLLNKDKEITQPILKECNIDINSFHEEMKNILKEPVKYYEIKQNINEPEFTNLALQIFDEWLDEGLIKN